MPPPAYIIAARRSANGRLGGIHRQRRLEALAAPVLGQALADAGLAAERIDLLALGNTTAGSNPARVVGLVAGVGERAVALTVDRGATSGLEALLWATGAIARGEAATVAAGGAEAYSTAPWRIAKPRTLQHMPRFVGLAQTEDGESSEAGFAEAAEALARRLSIDRRRQDEHAVASHIRAGLARQGRPLAREIVALKARAEEARDELVDDLDIDDLEAFAPLLADGTLTRGNTSLPADGAAFLIAVSPEIWRSLGAPPALVIEASASLGVAAGREAEAALEAARAALARARIASAADLHAIELGEASAVEAIAFREALGTAETAFNVDGGQIARGEPGGAAGAVLMVRLFSRLAAAEGVPAGARGMAAVATSGGQALAVIVTRA